MSGVDGYDKVTRFEVIDHRRCKACDGEGFRDGNPCTKCGGSGVMGRILVENSVNIEVLELQDNDRTLKVRLVDREEK